MELEDLILLAAASLYPYFAQRGVGDPYEKSVSTAKQLRKEVLKRKGED